MDSFSTILQVLEFLGTFAFAISGIRHAAAKHFDWFGGYVCGVAVAIGGGTIRDLVLGTTPFWMTNPFYLLCTALALLLVVWIFLALIRGAMYLWLASKCLFLLTRKTPMFCIISSGIGSLLIAAFVPLYVQVFENQILWGSAMLTVTLAVPLLTALFPQKRGEQR